ncbi:uncharacterized protein TNCV_1708541 [Trichonephila clavipes]|nr:uncharacterized protein TNCV_1708541 [Trichonephila clavipes]
MAAVAEWYRYRTVACFVTGSSPVPLKTRRVGQRCTLNLSRAETSSRWERYGTTKAVTGSNYLDALQRKLFPQLEKSEPNNFIWQQDGASPRWHLSVRDWLNITLPKKWIGRKVPPDKACMAFPPRSLDLTPCDFYL